MEFILTILGVSGATPAYGRFPTSQFLQIQNHYFLIDCGEGAQMRLNEYGLPKGKIDHIFISHLHGDHVFGLPGLLFSYALNDRAKPLHIYAPDGLEEMIKAQLNPGGKFPYPIHFYKTNTTTCELILENEAITVHSIPLDHRIETTGYLFREKPFPKNIDPRKIKSFNLSIPQIIAAKDGRNILLDNGQTIPNNDLTLPPYIPRSYAFLTDTKYDERVIPLIKKVNLLYHEATFCEDKADQAAEKYHSTAKQAATIALKAQVEKLIIGHFSSRYRELDQFLIEAKSIFEKTELGEEGKKYEVNRVRIAHKEKG